MDYLDYFSVETLPEVRASAVFTVDSRAVFREDVDESPVTVDDKTSYMPRERGQG